MFIRFKAACQKRAIASLNKVFMKFFKFTYIYIIFASIKNFQNRAEQIRQILKNENY